jgi:hypothetical protein
MSKANDIFDEVKSVLKGKTFDALLPPLVFTLVNNLSELNKAIIISVITGVIILILRVAKRDRFQYSLAGLAVVLFAALLAYISGNAANYYIPAALGSFLFFLVSFISIFIDKPIAAFTSHITRGWDLEWYFRDDIKPAYKEVSILWTVFFAARLIIQIFALISGNIASLTFINVILSFPITLTVLILSYIYGIWRLSKLGGPGIEEFKANKPPPWSGQKKGF